jgi:4'-phosphopantetheinyl transferase EntD
VTGRALELGFFASIALPKVGEDTKAALFGAISEEERAMAASFGLARAITFAGGRIALREALVGIGFSEPPPILSTDRGAPRLPDGVQGSISHKNAIACALARRALPRTAIGVDVEEIGLATDRIARFILTERERESIERQSDVERLFTLARAMSLKESIYKAIDPFVQRYVGFHEVEVWPGEDGTARVDLGTMIDAFECEARWFREDPYVFTTVQIRARH